MGIRFCCPECAAEYELADRLAGKKIRCKKCEAVVAVPDDADTAEALRADAPPRRPTGRPSRRGGDRDDDAEVLRPKKSGSSLPLILGLSGGGVVLLGLLLCGSCFFLLPGRLTLGPPKNVSQGNGPPNPPPNPGPVINPPPGDKPPPAAAWDVKADPMPRPPVKAANPGKVASLKGDFPYILTAPSTPSPFVASGLPDFPQHKQEIWNLETMEKTGEVRGFQMTGYGVLSPDGAYSANTLNQAGQPLVVIACKDAAKVFEVDMRQLPPTDFIDFAGSRQLIVGFRGSPRVYHLYEVPSGRKLREIVVKAEHDERSEALSPGGKYLAIKSAANVLFFNLEQGQPAGQFAIPNSWNNLNHRELAFAPDGKELALLFESDSGLRILTWDLEGNKLGVDHTVPAVVRKALKTPRDYHGRHLEWLGDGSGWLIKGEVVIDKRRGAAIWQLGLRGDEWRNARHMVGSTHVAVLGGTLDARTLGLVEIRPAQGGPVGSDPPPPPPPPPTVVRWQVKPDPLPPDLTPPEKPEGSIPITGYPPQPNHLVDQVVFPTSPSPFVAVAVKGSPGDAHEVWDLRSMKRVGTIQFKHPYSTELALSPDGAYLSKPSFQLKGSPGADIHAFADNRSTRITVTTENRWAHTIDFGGPDQLVTVRYVPGVGGSEVQVCVWDLKTRAEVRQFVAPAYHNRKEQAFSPGRRYLALAARDDKRVLLYDLTNGQLSGILQAGGTCHGLAFAADGKSLAGLFKTGTVTHLRVWDLATGKATAMHRFDKEPVPSDTVYQGQPLEWLPDGGGWLLYGRALVDGQSGAVYWRIAPAGAHDRLPRRIFGSGQLAYVKDEGRTRTLVIESLPMDKVTEALKAARAGR